MQGFTLTKTPPISRAMNCSGSTEPVVAMMGRSQSASSLCLGCPETLDMNVW